MAYESLNGEPGMYIYKGIKVRFDFKMLSTNEVEEARAWVEDEQGDAEVLLLQIQGLWADKAKAYEAVKSNASVILDKLIAEGRAT